MSAVLLSSSFTFLVVLYTLVQACTWPATMASEASVTSAKPRRLEPDLETVPLARVTRKTVERLAPFCQMRLPPSAPNVPLVPKTNSKVLRLIQAVDTSMLVAQIGYRLANDAAALCDPFAPSSTAANGNNHSASTSTPEMLQTMAAHGHGHVLRTSETFRDVQQEIYKIAAVTKDNDVIVLVPPDPQQPAILRKALKDVGSDLVANLNLLSQFSRGILDLTSWWEWLEEELMAPNSTLLPSPHQRDAELYARWNKIKGGYLDYYNTIRVVYTRYPQLLTTSSTAWQSTSSVPPPPSSPGSSWDGSFQDLGEIMAASDDAPVTEAQTSGKGKERQEEGEKKKEKKEKSGKSGKNVTILVGKIGLAKMFSGRKKGNKEATKIVKKDKGKGKEKAEEQDKEKEEAVLDVARPSEQQDKASKIEEVQHAEKAVDDQRSAHSSSSSSSSSKSNSEPEKKSGVAKLLALLGRALSRLSCHKSEADD